MVLCALQQALFGINILFTKLAIFYTTRLLFLWGKVTLH